MCELDTIPPIHPHNLWILMTTHKWDDEKKCYYHHSVIFFCFRYQRHLVKNGSVYVIVIVADDVAALAAASFLLKLKLKVDWWVSLMFVAFKKERKKNYPYIFIRFFLSPLLSSLIVSFFLHHYYRYYYYCNVPRFLCVVAYLPLYISIIM